MTFVLLGFLSMLALESVGILMTGPPSPLSCSLLPATLANLTQPVRVVCREGLVTVLGEG